MDNTILILVFAAIFGSMVGNRASRLGRNPWAWGIPAFLLSPLIVWIVLEIVGRKEVESLDESYEEFVLDADASEKDSAAIKAIPEN